MKPKRASFIILFAILLLVIVLHNKLHSATTVQQSSATENITNVYFPANNTLAPSPFLRLTE